LPDLPPIPARLSRIDELIRDDHAHLTAKDDCYFLWEWSVAPYAESATTNFIGNFQRETRFRRQNPWWYKEQAINHAAAALAQTVPKEWIAKATFIPMPPSKIKTDERYDSRLLDTLHLVPVKDAREMVLQLINGESRQKNISPVNRAHNWKLDDPLTRPKPAHFVIFDDLITGGSHFAAMKIVLARKFVGIPITGLFLARRVFANAALES
jgi:hypothetical protein